MKTIPVIESSLPPFEEYTEEIKCLWDSRFLTNMGIKHQTLEKQLKEYLGSDNITMFTNGHMALEGALEALDMKGEVITTPFTFASTTHAIVRKGLTPVFCDIKSSDGTIDEAKIEALITEKTCAIVPVHVYGHMCNVEAIEAISKKHHLKVIYDAAHAFGVTYKGQSAANFGDISMFSFHATKVFNTIEGGALVYQDPALERKLYYVKNFGIKNQDEVVTVGGNAKMNEFQAAMGICNLRHLNEFIAKRKSLYESYMAQLQDVAGITTFEIQQNVVSNYSYFPILVEGFALSRDELKEQLEAQGIMTRKYFYPLVSDYACYRDQYDSSKTPVARHFAECALTLPLYDILEQEDVDRICNAIKALGSTK